MGAPDVLVIGGGVFGLSVAEAATRAGLTVTLADAASIGAGASGGPVGALVPFAPRGRSPVAPLQLAGLASLPAMAQRLKDTTGLDPGYSRTGRLTPLPDEAALTRARADIEAARGVWPAGPEGRLLSAPPDAGWLDPTACACGVLAESLSARVTPHLWLTALRAAAGPRLTVLEGWRACALEADGRVRLDRGEISAGHVVVAAGATSLALLAPLGSSGGHTVGGQAALLDVPGGDRPVIAARGLWIVPHRSGVAVGSTREPGRTDTVPDDRLDELVARARAISPTLRNAAVIRRWAGLRPHGPDRRPLVGPLPDAPRLIAATGAGGIGFAIAHLVAEAVVAGICGMSAPVSIPADFAPSKRPAAEHRTGQGSPQATGHRPARP